ncbi:MAG: ABC transporter ATP-binding protein [Deltaproteobacteria bacterium]|nr:ABC transporter ATP-binding protein [Deltaproteobacteria bacterium]
MALVVNNLVLRRREGFTLNIHSLEVCPGEILGIVGKSGSGKSTLFHAVAGFLPVESGSIRLNDVILNDVPPEKRRIALVFQNGALFPHLTIYKNVEFSLRVQKFASEDREKKVTAWLERLGVADLAARYPSQISGGQAQRVALARALVTQFPVLLLDEPFSALDVPLQRELRTEVRKLVSESKVCAMMVTHQPQDVLAICDRIAILSDGQVKKSGSPEELRNDPLLQ